MIIKKIKYGNWEWLLVFSLASAAIFLGTFGYQQLSQQYSFLETLFRSVQLLSLQSGAVEGPIPLLLELARWCAALAVAVAILKTAWVYFHDRIRLWYFRKHIIVCGLGRKGAYLVKAFREGKIKRQVVVIENEDNNDEILACEEAGAIVIRGNCTDKVLLRKSGLKKARFLLVVSGEDETNAEVVIKAAQILDKSKHKHPILCFVHIVDPELKAFFKRHDIFTRTNDAIDVRIFNIFDRSTRALLEIQGLPSYINIDSHKSVNHGILIFGSGWIARYLVIQIARMAYDAKGGKPAITIIDYNVSEVKTYLEVHFPQLNNFISLNTVNNVQKIISKELIKNFSQKSSVTAIYVAIEEELHAVTIGELLRMYFPLDIPIVILFTQRSSVSYLAKDMEKIFATKNIFFFDLVKEAWRGEDFTGEQIERFAHLVNRDIEINEHNKTQIDWDDLPSEKKLERRYYADNMKTILATFSMNNMNIESTDIELVAKIEHYRWMVQKTLDGWTQEKERDDIKLTDPNLVSWEELRPEFRDKLTIRANRIAQLISKETQKK